MDLKDTYNLIAEDWMKDHENDDWWNKGTEKFLSLLKPGSHILDVGCAGGWKAAFIISKGFKVTGIDLSEKMIEIAKRNVPQGEFYPMDLHDISHLTGTFDAIFAQAVLLHIPKKEIVEVMRKIADKLKPQGYFYVAVKSPWPGNPEEEIVKENDYGYEYERFFSYYTIDEVREYFKQLGMKIVFEHFTSHTKTTWVQVIAQK